MCYFRNFYIWNTYLRKKNIRKNLGGGRQESTHTLRHNLSVWYSTSWSRCTNGLIKSPIIFALSVIATVSVVFVLCRTLCSFPSRKLWFGKPLHSPTIFVTTTKPQYEMPHMHQAFCWNCSGFTVGKRSGICKKLFVWSLSNSPKSTSSKDHAFSPSSSPDLV